MEMAVRKRCVLRWDSKDDKDEQKLHTKKCVPSAFCQSVVIPFSDQYILSFYKFVSIFLLKQKNGRATHRRFHSNQGTNTALILFHPFLHVRCERTWRVVVFENVHHLHKGTLQSGTLDLHRNEICHNRAWGCMVVLLPYTPAGVMDSDDDDGEDMGDGQT